MILSLSSKFQNLKTLGPSGSLCVEEIGGVFRGQQQQAGFRIVDSRFRLKRVFAKFLEAEDANVSNADAVNHVWDKLGCVS
jgi:hypothetical protein